MAAAGSLESTLTTLTDLVAQENHKTVVLACNGLDLVPARYQATIKNVAIQLIRNAVVHGIESAAEREQPANRRSAPCTWNSKSRPAMASSCCFKTMDAGLDPDKVREIAVAKGLLTEEEAKQLSDRQAIKLIFKSGFTTMADSAGRREARQRHVAGAALCARGRRQDRARQPHGPGNPLQNHPAGAGRSRRRRASRVNSQRR